jgi:tetratricopeptide (TPR) repeat protein
MRYADASEEFIRALKLKADYFEAFVGLAESWVDAEIWEKGKKADYYKNAIGCYQRALAVKSDAPDVHVALGKLYFKLDRFEDALREFKLAVAINPNHDEAYNEIGLTHDMIAFNWKLQATVTIDKSLKEALKDEELKSYADATAAYKKAVTINPDTWGWRRLAVDYGYLGQYDAAIDAMDRAIERDQSSDPSTADDFISWCRKTGQLRNEVSTLQQMTVSKPDNKAAHFYLGRVYVALGDKKAALQEYKVLKELSPLDAQWLFEAMSK